MTVKVFYHNTKNLKTVIHDVDFIAHNEKGELILVRPKNSIILGKDLYDIEVWCSR